MAEYRVFENEQVTEMVLKYADPKYTFALMRKQDEDSCPDTLWSLHESQQEAEKRQKSETEAYDDDPEFQFYVCEIHRNEQLLKSFIGGKPHDKVYHTFTLKRVEAINH